MATINIKQDSLKKRYFYKIITNLVGLAIAFITQALVPRALGPVAYGNFGFISDYFTRVIAFLNAGASLGFYTKLSQRPNETPMIRFFWMFVILVAIILCLIIIATLSLDYSQYIWPSQTITVVWMGLVWGLMSWIIDITRKIIDAYGVTVQGELIAVSQKIFGLCIVIILYYKNWLNLTTIFLYQYLIMAFIIVVWWVLLDRNNISLFPSSRLSREEKKKYTNEYYKYSMPLLLYASIQFGTGVFDRWLLQWYGGSIEQGLFTLSNKIAIICFLFSSAMVPLIMREYSIASQNNDLKYMRKVFLKYIPLFYAVSVYISVFVSVQATFIVKIVGGEQYSLAVLPMAIMSLFPIHQTYGQLSNSLFYAAGRTKLYSKIASTILLIGVPITFYTVAPKSMNGLELGATGLAIKMLIMQIVSVNVFLVYNCRFLKIKLSKILWHQLYILVIFYCTAYGVTKLLATMFVSNIIVFFLSGVIYSVVVALFILLVPQSVSLNRRQINQLFSTTFKLKVK
jgi:O-antigen/teichoic acid export membrane protein